MAACGHLLAWLTLCHGGSRAQARRLSAAARLHPAPPRSWKAKLAVKEMCEDQWRWASQNPDGFLTGKKS